MTKRLKYQLNYADGYYIEKDGEGYLDFAEEVAGEEAQSVCDALNNRDATIAEMREALGLWLSERDAMVKKGVVSELRFIKEHTERILAKYPQKGK